MALFRTLGTVLRVKLEAYCCVYIQETDKQLRLPAILLCQNPFLQSLRERRSYRGRAHIQTRWYNCAAYPAILKQINFRQTKRTNKQNHYSVFQTQNWMLAGLS